MPKAAFRFAHHPAGALRRGLLPGLLATAMLVGSQAPTRAAPAPSGPDFQVEDRGPIFGKAHPRVLGLDGAFSVPVGNGRSLWIFGDTLLGTWKPNGDRRIEAMPPNTAALVEDGDWVTGYANARFLGTPDPVPLLSPSQPTARIWPLDAVREKDVLRQFYVEVESQGTGPLDFRVTGTGVVSGKGIPAGALQAKAPLWAGDAPSFGASVFWWQGAWYLYAGGAKTHLARAEGPLDRADSYRYWAGEGRWVADPLEATALPGSGPELSVRYNAYLKAFVMVYVPPFGNLVEMRLAPAPWGPWSEPRRLAACQPARDGQVMFYGAKQHAELDVDGGRQIVVTYNTNTAETLLAERPDLYWPRLLRVTFR